MRYTRFIHLQGDMRHNTKEPKGITSQARGKKAQIFQDLLKSVLKKGKDFNILRQILQKKE